MEIESNRLHTDGKLMGSRLNTNGKRAGRHDNNRSYHYVCQWHAGSHGEGPKAPSTTSYYQEKMKIVIKRQGAEDPVHHHIIGKEF